MEIDSATLREINKKYSRNRVETDSAALREKIKTYSRVYFTELACGRQACSVYFYFFSTVLFHNPLYVLAPLRAYLSRKASRPPRK